jgi:uncharacterized protein
VPVTRHIVAVFLKFPQPGKVKTRLAAELGADRAAEVYADLVAETLRHLPWERLEVWLCFDPPDKESAVKEWLAPLIPENALVQFVPQAAGGLGERLRVVMDLAFAHLDISTLTFVGTDCPEMRWPVFVIMERMFRENIDAVFGPSLDGGYYLLALRRPCPELFENIPWSTERTLTASLAAAERAGCKVHLLERTLRDIDTVEDFLQWRKHGSD